MHEGPEPARFRGSGYSASAGGNLTLLGQTATGTGTVDATASPDGRFRYVQAGGNGIVDEFRAGGRHAHLDWLGHRARRHRRRGHRRCLSAR